MRPTCSLLLAALVTCTLACEKKTPAAEPSRPGAASPAPEREVVLLGEVGSLTGSQAVFGISSRNGFDMALREANAAGGVKGHPLALRVYDSQGKPEESAQAVTRLLTQDKVVLILGEVSSSGSMAMAEKAQAAGVPMISHAATNPAVTQKGDYIFRVCFIDPFQGYVMAKFAREDLSLEQVAILQDTKSDYSSGLTTVFSREFIHMGGRISTVQSYAQGDTDFRAQLTAIKQARPQALYIPGYYTDVGLIARQAREVGLTVTLLGSDGWDAETLYELGGAALEGSYFTNPYAMDSPEPRMKKFVADYQALYGSLPDTSSVLAYEATLVAVDALARAPDWSGPSLRDTLARTRDFPGIAGPITLDANRNAIKPAVVVRVHEGKANFVKTIPPP
jgi:branched-chain amino acid transport system substrate-binding protein